VLGLFALAPTFRPAGRSNSRCRSQGRRYFIPSTYRQASIRHPSLFGGGFLSPNHVCRGSGQSSCARLDGWRQHGFQTAGPRQSHTSWVWKSTCENWM